MEKKFGANDYIDAIGDLLDLKQTNSVEEYITAFENLQFEIIYGIFSVLLSTISLQAVFVYRCSVLLMFACLVKTTLLQVLFCGT